MEPVAPRVEGVPDSPAGPKEKTRLLLIAPPNSYRTAPYLEAARRLGVSAMVACEGRFSLVSEIAEGLHVDLEDPGAVERLLAANAACPFTGIVATDDASVELGSRVAQALNLAHNPPHAARLSRRKDLSRQALAAAGVPVPRFWVIDLLRPIASQLDGVAFPCVVKPLSLSASRGVIRVDDASTLKTACARVQRILASETTRDSFAATHLLIESFIPGPEVALEGLLRRGRLNVLAIFDKPDPLNGDRKSVV